MGQVHVTSELRKAIEGELLQWPGFTYSFGTGGKHAFLCLQSPDGQSRKVWISISPSARNAVRDILGDVRRTIRVLNS